VEILNKRCGSIFSISRVLHNRQLQTSSGMLRCWGSAIDRKFCARTFVTNSNRMRCYCADCL